MPDTALPDGTVVTESFWTPNVRQQVVTQCTSATRPTGVEGREINETDTDLKYVHNGTGWEQIGGWGGWTSFTPQIDQGASLNIAKTVTYSKWTRGPRRTITWTFNLALTAAGTAGSNVTLTLPVTAAAAQLAGVGQVFDTSTSTRYTSTLELSSTTALQFVGDWSGTSAWGTSPNLALASGDILRGSITYEAAT
jgi:hypothetical protein